MKYHMLCLIIFLSLIIYQMNDRQDEKTETPCLSFHSVTYTLEAKIKTDELFPKEMTEPEWTEADLSHSVFIGNSKIEGLRNSGLLMEADYICKVGWNITKIFDEKKATGDELLIEHLNDREYDKMFLMFGDNELGWKSISIFIEKYKESIEQLHERQPDAEIYIMSIFPVSRKVHEQNQWGVNNTHVVQFNEALKKMCEEEGYHYLDIHSILVNDDGMLPDSSSSDGIHPNHKQLERVVDYIKENVKE